MAACIYSYVARMKTPRPAALSRYRQKRNCLGAGFTGLGVGICIARRVCPQVVQRPPNMSKRRVDGELRYAIRGS